MKTSHRSRRRKLTYEQLESREVMAAGITASLSAGGVLNVYGTDGNDLICVPAV